MRTGISIAKINIIIFNLIIIIEKFSLIRTDKWFLYGSKPVLIKGDIIIIGLESI